MHAAQRTRLPHQEDLVLAHGEDLPGDGVKFIGLACPAPLGQGLLIAPEDAASLKVGKVGPAFKKALNSSSSVSSPLSSSANRDRVDILEGFIFRGEMTIDRVVLLLSFVHS